MQIEQKKPNIILITIDALRPDYLGAYGNNQNISPNIDNLAKDGVLFTNNHSPHYGTDPAHTTIFTGLYPESHGIVHHGDQIQKEEIKSFLKISNQFLPKVLKENQYKTFALDWLGRWHRTGFDHYSGIVENTMLNGYNYFYRKIYLSLPYSLVKHIPGNISSYESAESITSNAKKLITKNSENPFFLFTHFWDTHTPYDPPKRHRMKYTNIKTKYNKKIEEILNEIEDPKFKAYTKLCTHGTKYTDEIVHRYMGSINYVDEQIGKIIFHLKSLGLYDNTLIIIMSDHGESLGEHDTYFVHHTVYEELLKSALIIKFPSQEYANEQVDNIVNHVDVFPTILDVIGIKNDFRVDGMSLIPLIGSEDYSEPRDVYFGFMAEGVGLGGRIGVIDGDWKYSLALTPVRTCPRCGIIQIHHQTEELFNLKEDPVEEKNLINEKNEIAKKLREKVLKHRKGNKIETEKDKISKSIMKLKTMDRRLSNR